MTLNYHEYFLLQMIKGVVSDIASQDCPLQLSDHDDPLVLVLSWCCDWRTAEDSTLSQLISTQTL